jgi:putative ATP-grasp target RiPP
MTTTATDATVSSTIAPDPLAPARGMFALSDIATPHDAPTRGRPWGLSLADVSINSGGDLSEVRYDPMQQVSVGADGLPTARTQYTINTPHQTRYDHSTFSDNDPDTRTD